MKKSWTSSLVEAVRANPKLSGMVAIELGLIGWATLKAKRGRSPSVPPAETVIEMIPAIAAAVVAAPVLTPKRRKR